MLVVVNYLLAGDVSGVGVFLGIFSSQETLLLLPFSGEQMSQSSTWHVLFVLHRFYTYKPSENLRQDCVAPVQFRALMCARPPGPWVYEISLIFILLFFCPGAG